MKNKQQKKVTYEVQENETVSDCLDRIQKDGYTPVRRTEVPIFQEKTGGKDVSYEPVGRQIIFEVKKADML
ncbi:NETI motif-containing protein [Niallia oryzisoli]|uniref:NETI motif-containing protein n=1 Tax=Niallia oryzisoli TaxID=1737571 RepID=UPI0037360552